MSIGRQLACAAGGALMLAAAAAQGADFLGPEGAADTFGTRDLDALLRENPLAPGENIKAIALQRSAHSAHVLVQVRDREPVHYHADSDITVLMLRGGGTLHIGDRKFTTKAGDTAFIPRGVVHFFANGDKTPSAALVTYSPPPGPQDRVLVSPAR